MYKALMDPDDIGHSYDVICLESCAHPGSYIYWNEQSGIEIYVRRQNKMYMLILYYFNQSQLQVNPEVHSYHQP